MKNKKLHVPAGLRDALPAEFAKKQILKSKISEVFDSYGYKQISTPTFEYIEVFENSGSTSKTQIYKFIDREGEILALRPDMTPAISRIVATNYSKQDLPLRLSYIQTAFRNNEDFQGKMSEFTQAGVELVGVASRQADGEVIALAIQTLKSANLQDFCIDIGHVGFLQSVLENSGISQEIQKSIQQNISAHNFVELNKIIEQVNINANIKKLLASLCVGVGNLEVLSFARSLIDFPDAISALDELEQVYNIICDYNLEKYIRLDLGMTQKFDYYTGVLFRGYTYGSGFWLVDGGRYDNLIQNYGLDTPSVGFGISVDNLLLALEKQNYSFEQKQTSLIIFEKNNQKNAIQKAQELRKLGKCAELALLEDIQANLDYAKQKNIVDIIVL